jgi:hypothetical protein
MWMRRYVIGAAGQGVPARPSSAARRHLGLRPTWQGVPPDYSGGRAALGRSVRRRGRWKVPVRRPGRDHLGRTVPP